MADKMECAIMPTEFPKIENTKLKLKTSVVLALKNKRFSKESTVLNTDYVLPAQQLTLNITYGQ